MKNLMYIFLFIVFFSNFNLFSQSIKRVVFSQHNNGKIINNDTLWFSENAKKTRFYYYDLNKMQRLKIYGKDTLITQKNTVQKDLKKQYSSFKTELLKEKPTTMMEIEVKKAKIFAKGEDSKNSRFFEVYYIPMKIHKNFYFDDIFKDIPGLVVYWGIDDENFTQISEIIDVDLSEMKIPTFSR